MQTLESDTTQFTTNCGKFYITQCYSELGCHSNVLNAENSTDDQTASRANCKNNI